MANVMPRIMTYNVHRCVGMDGKLDVARTAKVIAQCRPDVVALQELDVRRQRTGLVDQAHAIAELVGMRFHFHPAFQVEEESYGDAILSAAPMRLVKAGPLPGSKAVRGLEPRGALWVKIDLDGTELDVVNTHLGLVPHEQRAQADALVSPQWLAHADCTDPAILLGDFNAPSTMAPIAAWPHACATLSTPPGGARCRPSPRAFRCCGSTTSSSAGRWA
jgi:endonuclease/exonuclease/phosphatase family metal-dependent hydrolase